MARVRAGYNFVKGDATKSLAKSSTNHVDSWR